MILIECTWCEADLALGALDATSIECPDCRYTVDIAPDPEPVAVAA